MLHSAVMQLRSSQRLRFGVPLSVNVNVSPKQLSDENIVADFTKIIEAGDVDPACITLELTESSALENDVLRRRLVKLGDISFSIAADDFGSGFASYASLTKLPFTMVKLDHSLLEHLGTDGGVSRVRSRRSSK